MHRFALLRLGLHRPRHWLWPVGGQKALHSLATGPSGLLIGLDAEGMGELARRWRFVMAAHSVVLLSQTGLGRRSVGLVVRILKLTTRSGQS